MIPKINSAHGSDTRNIINRAIEVLNRLGIDVQTLVAEGQLTEKQYAELITVINGHLKSGEVDKLDLTPELRSEVDKVKNKIGKGEVSVHDIDKNRGKLDSTFFTSDFIEQLTKGTIDVTNLLDESVTREKIARTSVSEEKTTFINISTNLLNKEDVKRNTNLDVATGEEINSSVASVFNKEFVVFPGEQYTSAALSTRCFYRLDGSFVAGNTGNGTFTVPSNARIMKMSSTNLDAAQLNRGAAELSYEPYFYEVVPELNSLKPDAIENIHLREGSVSIRNTDFFDISSNLVNTDNINEGYGVDSSNGELSANSTVDTTDFLPVQNNTEYTGNMIRHTEYDVDGNFIISWSHTGALEGKTFKTTSQTRFLRVTHRKQESEIRQLNIGTELLDYEPYYARLKGVYLPSTPSKSGRGGHVTTTTEMYSAPAMSDLSNSTSGFIYSYQEIYDFYDALVSAYPDYVTREHLRDDVDGRPIYQYRFRPEGVHSSGDDIFNLENELPKFFINTGTHGFEKASIWTTYLMFREICESWRTNTLLEQLRFNVEFVLIPIVNPYSYEAHSRKNKNGVDIMRNYPAAWAGGHPDPESSMYRGPSALSEIESQAVYDVYQIENFDYVVDYHNFFGSSESESPMFLWLGSSDDFVVTMAQRFVRKMTNKWKYEKLYYPEDDKYAIGRVDKTSVGIYRDATEDGIMANLYEISGRIFLEPDQPYYSSDVNTMGAEAFANWMYMVYINL